MSETVVAEFSALAGRDPLDRLPAEAAERLEALRSSREQAADLARVASTRTHEARAEWQRAKSHLAEIERAYDTGSMMRTTRVREPRGDGLDDLELHPKERVLVEKVSIERDDKRLAVEAGRVAKLRKTFERRQAELSRLSEARDAFGRLGDATEEYLRRLPRRTAIEMHRGAIKLPKGIDTAAAVEHAREQHRALAEEVLDVEQAPFPADEIKAALAGHIDRLARRPDIESLMASLAAPSMPTMRLNGLSAILGSGDAGVVAGAIADSIGLIAWLHRDQLIEALSAMVDAQAEPDVALTRDDRTSRLADLRAKILECERVECRLLELASEAGAALLPRPDTDPRAYLNLAGDLPAPNH